MTRTTPVRFLRACIAVAAALANRTRVRLLGRAIRPPYLTAQDLKCFRKIQTSPDRHSLPPTAPSAALHPAASAWALGKKEEFQTFMRTGEISGADPETAWTLHQMGWLFGLVLMGPSTIPGWEVNDLLETWIARFGDARTDRSWRSYSISERICHWLTILEFFPDLAVRPRLRETVARQAVHLAAHLEEYCDGTTNNHIMNNGRALYRGGLFLGSEPIARLGKKILIAEVGRRVTSEGVLDEGSSHYQLLMTKNYMEILREAEAAGDGELLRALRKPVAAMLRSCAILRDPVAPEEWQIPYFGDISPDLPPVFMGRGSYFWTAAERCARGQGMELSFLTPWYRPGEPADSCGTFDQPGWHVLPKSGYYRWNGSRFSLWWHVRQSGAPRQHAHNDWGSFQLNRGGQPLIIDPGRSTYVQVPGVSDKRLTLEQNSVMIGDFEQAIPMKRNLFDPRYLGDSSDVRFSGEGETAELSVVFRGYERLGHPVTATRRFRMDSRTLRIDDRLEGQGRAFAAMALHLHPSVRCEEEKAGSLRLIPPQGGPAHLILESAGRTACGVKYGGSPAIPGGTCSSRYGESRVTTSIFAAYNQSLPAAFTHELSVVS